MEWRYLAAALAAMIALCAPVRAFADRTLKPTRTLHAQPVTGQPYSAIRPHPRQSIPLRVPNRQAYAALKAQANRRYETWRQAGAQTPSRDGQWSSKLSAPAPRAGLIENFNQLGLIANEEANTEGTPPDPTGAIGPGYYVEFVNSKIAIYSRTNLSAPVTTESEDGFTGGSSTCDGQIRWDQQASRWEYASLDCGESSGYSFGWSKSEDPTNLTEGWCKYHESTGTTLYDYPKLGGNDEYLLIGANKFEMTAEEKYLGSVLLVIPKPVAPVKGVEVCPASPSITEFSVPAFTPVPVNIFGASTAGYAVAADYPEESEPTPTHLRLFTVTKGTLAPQVSESSIAVPGYTVPAGVPQPGTTDELDSSDTRITQAVGAEEPLSHELAIWTQHTVAATLGGPSFVQWFELKPGSSTPVQSGKVQAPEGNFAFNAAISPTAAGDGALIQYNVGGSKMLVQLRAQSRVSGMAAGTLTGEVTLAESSAIDKDFSCPSAKIIPGAVACRWGDYAGASPDPANAEVVWGTGQFNGPLPALEYSPQWRTENFKLTADTPPVASFSASSLSPAPGESVTFDGSASSDSDGTVVSYKWSFGDSSQPQTSSTPTVSHTYSSPGRYIVTLTVTDDKGLTGEAQQEVTVDAPPTASFAVGSSSPAAMTPVGFDGSASKDDGSIVSYSWTFGDGGTASGVTPSHVYAKSGQYTVTLTVTDNAGKSNSVSQAVNVAAVPATPSAAASPTASVPSGKPQPPSNLFRVLRVRPNKKNGSVLVTVSVPDPGVLSARDPRGARAGSTFFDHALAIWQLPTAHETKSKRHRRKKTVLLVRPASLTASKGTVTLTLVPTAAAQKQLSRKHKLSVKVSITFTPTGGTPRTIVQTVVLQKVRAKHRRRHK